jgi:hypothetical protein
MIMATYTRFGEVAQLTEARLIPMWFIKMPSEIRASYTKPRKVPKKATVEEFPSWHYRGTGDKGRRICDGKWVEAATSLRADDGWREIQDRLNELNPEDATKWKEWNKAGAPEASHFFTPITDKEAA